MIYDPNKLTSECLLQLDYFKFYNLTRVIWTSLTINKLICHSCLCNIITPKLVDNCLIVIDSSSFFYETVTCLCTIFWQLHLLCLVCSCIVVNIVEFGANAIQWFSFFHFDHFSINSLDLSSERVDRNVVTSSVCLIEHSDSSWNNSI